MKGLFPNNCTFQQKEKKVKPGKSLCENKSKISRMKYSNDRQMARPYIMYERYPVGNCIRDVPLLIDIGFREPYWPTSD